MCDECATAMRAERAAQGPPAAGGAEKPAGERPAEGAAAGAVTAPLARERPPREHPPRRERPFNAVGAVAFVPASRELPRGYLEGGYFAPSGALRREVLTDWAEQVAQALAAMPSDSTAQQLRVFFNHVRRVWDAFKFGKRPIEPVLNEIQKLKAFAVERSLRRKAPEVFRRFIEANVDRVVDEKTLQGFVQHFQAVAAYAGGLLQIRKERR
jgi:CRISPR type III-A-associated protein Csm2